MDSSSAIRRSGSGKSAGSNLKNEKARPPCGRALDQAVMRPGSAPAPEAGPAHVAARAAAAPAPAPVAAIAAVPADLRHVVRVAELLEHAVVDRCGLSGRRDDEADPG